VRYLEPYNTSFACRSLYRKVRTAKAVIRYVLAMTVAATILSVSLVAVEYTASERAETDVETAIHELDSTATELYESEPLAERGQQPPRRMVTLSLPTDGIGSIGVDTFTIQSGTNGTSQVEYRLDDGEKQTQHLSVPVVVKSDVPLDMSDARGDVHLSLTLIEHEGAPTVVVERV